MAVKTITIDMEAYEILLKAKKGKEPFSQVIKNTLSPRRKTAENLLANLDDLILAEDTLDTVDVIIPDRKNSLTDSAIRKRQSTLSDVHKRVTKVERKLKVG